MLADTSTGPTIAVSGDDWYGVQRVANDLAVDFGRVTGVNGTFVAINGSTTIQSSVPVIVAGTTGKSTLIDSLVEQGMIDVSETEGQWEAYTTRLVGNPMEGVSQALVIAGADKRGTIYGLYDISEQMGVSPWYWWADVAAMPQQAVYAMNVNKRQGSPAVKYRGFFINDEQPALTNWVSTRFPGAWNSTQYDHEFWSLIYELLLRMKANYFWVTTWGSMFYIDDPLNAKTADDYGVVVGTSHTEPMTLATNEQGSRLNGTWAWEGNRENVTAFFREGAERSAQYETMYTLGMRGLGDAESPTLNSSQLEDIVRVQQRLLAETHNTTNVSSIPMMWCLYKEVGGYWAQGMDVPDDITLLWADDNWADMQRLPLTSERNRSGGAGIYYHADYVGDPRDYKWLDTNSLAKYWQELIQAYDRGARQIWILNVGDLKPMEVPLTYFLDMAYNAPSMSSPNSTSTWLQNWARKQWGQDVASQTASILTNYSVLSYRRKYELVDPSTYNIINYNEASSILSQWSTLASSAQEIYSSLSASLQPSYFQLVLHKILAGQNFHQVMISTATNNLYALQRRTSTNTWSQRALNYFNQDHAITQRYHSLLDGKWKHMMDQTHFGYDYWQQPMRNVLPPLSYVQTAEVAASGNLGVSVEGSNASIPGDDNYHALSSDSDTLPPMDPYGPNRWIDVYSRGNRALNFNVSSESFVTVTPSSGMLSGPDGNMTDLRLTVSVDWSSAPNGSTMSTINITTSTPSADDYLNYTAPYGNFRAPTIMLPLNKTSVPSSFHGHVESDAHISISAEHFSSNSSNSSSAYLSLFPHHSRTPGSSGIGLLPFTASSQRPNDTAAPRLTYDFYTFTPNISNANITVYSSAAMNTNPDRPLKYAISIDDSDPRVIQPNPLTTLWPLPEMWEGMVADTVMSNTTTHDLSDAGEHTLNLWIMEPGLIVQKVLVDLGGVRESYLGPPESMTV